MKRHMGMTHLQSLNSRELASVESSELTSVEAEDVREIPQQVSLDEVLNERYSERIIAAISDIQVERIVQWEASEFAAHAVVKDGKLSFDLRTQLSLKKALAILTGLCGTVTIIFPQISLWTTELLNHVRGLVLGP